MSEKGIGARVTRKEDHRFLTGNGHYTDDLQRNRQTHAAFLRSPHAHAKIRKVDTAAAKSAPGVVAVFTGADVAEAKVGSLICGWVVKDKHGEPHKAPAHPALAHDTVRHVGDPVAMVIAETAAQARDAAEMIVVDYEELPAVVNPAKALAKSAPQLHAEAPGNLCYDCEVGDRAAVDAAFSKAAHVAKVDLVNNRLIPNAMEPRAAAAEYDAGSGQYTLWTTSQNPHVTRLVLSAFVLGIPEHKLRVIAPDVGGGFGSKIFIYSEETMLTWACAKVNRPIKWTAERNESFVSDAHGRDHVTHAELAMDKDGKFLGFRVHTDANLGAYLSTFSTAVPTILYATLLAGQYKTPQVYVEVDSWFTNTAPVDAYRGAGRPEATYLLERIVSRAAWELGLSQDEIRRRNFITEFPYQTPVALQYDTGDFNACLDKANELAEISGFARQPPRPKVCCVGWATPATSRLVAWRRPTWRARWARARASSNAGRSVCTPPAA